MNVGNNTALPPDSPHLKGMYIMDNAYTYIYVCVHTHGEYFYIQVNSYSKNVGFQETL